MTVAVAGAARLSSSLRAAALELGDLGDGHAAVAAIIARAARPPRRTGRLAASVRPKPGAAGAVVEATAPYAGYVSGGVPARGIPARPFLADAVASSETEWMAAYGRAVQDVLDRVTGA